MDSIGTSQNINETPQNNQSPESRYVSPTEDIEAFKNFGKFLEENFAGANSKNLCV